MGPESFRLSSYDVDTIHDWVGSLESAAMMRSLQRRNISQVELPEAVAGMVRRAIVEVGSIEPIGRDLDHEIVRCFGVEETKNLVNYLGQKSATFELQSITSNDSGSEGIVCYTGTLSDNGTALKSLLSDSLPLRIPYPDIVASTWHFSYPGGGDSEREAHAYASLSALASEAIANTVGPLGFPVHYLPADRAGVMHAHQVAVRGLIARASRVGLRPEFPMPVLSGVLGDFLEQLVELASARTLEQRQGPNYLAEKPNDLAEKLERNLMKGSVSVERSQIDYPSFVYRPDGWERNLPLMNASSMVSELAPVALYLRHVVFPGHTLIIEEPESHLHPAMQVEFIRQLAAAVKLGIRVIITTHSEWVLEELANLLLLSELPEDGRTGIEGADLALTSNEVGVWAFEPSSDGGGSTVKEMQMDREVGKLPTDFGLVTADLYNRYAKITNRIERIKED